MTDKLQLGQLGERLAAEYLTKKGYQIIAKNYSTRGGEIDLICQKDKVIHFIEVKTRTNQKFGWPEEAVTDEKLEKIIMASEKYCQEYDLNSEWQIDIISILINQATRIAELRHLKNIAIT
ncbi:MAG: YraN family protein [Patescibacteria group bacterium]|jgi:putative endonuclease